MNFQISAWAIRNPIPVVCLFIALTLAGIVAYVQLPVKRIPNVAFPVVTVNVTQNGAAPAEVENQITRPIENALSGVAGVKHISSTVTLGVSNTIVEFELHADMQKAIDDVRTAVERTRILLPPGIDPPTVQRFDIDNAPILTYAVSSEKMSGTELSFFVDKVVTRALQAQGGVAQVQRVGGAEREINVILDVERMAALGVTAAQVNNALLAFNSDDPGGRATVGDVEQTIRVLGSGQTVDQIRDMTIPVAGRYVRLGDIAEVGDGEAEVRGFARLNGRPVTAVQVNKTADASEISVEDRVAAAVARLQAAHPDVRIERVFSTVDGTRRTFASTKHVLIEGIILAVVVVWLFLRNWRATMIAAAAMPLSLIPTFVVMSALGFSLNSITLLALTLVIGILVDDAIVEIENIEKRVEAGASPYHAALVGADAIGLAVVATTFTIVAVFAPVSMMPGQTGQFFREFGLTVSVAVLFSLVVARLLTPLMAAYFLKPLDKAHQREEQPLHPLYARVLNWALAHRWRSAGIGGFVFAIALVLAAFLPVGFQPKEDLGELYLAVQGPPGASRDDMDRAVRQATDILQAQPDVETVFANIGGTGASADLRTGTITVILRHDREMDTQSFKHHIAPLMRDVPDMRISNQGSFGMAPASVVLAGDDGEALERVQMQLLRDMRALKTLSDPRPSPPPSGPELVIIPRPAEAARLNVDSRTLAQAIRVATIGDIDANVAKYSEGENRLPIRVRLPESARGQLDVIAQLRVPTMDGNTTPLSSVADIEFRAGPAKILRYDRERQVAVEADLAPDATLGQALEEIQGLPLIRNLPEGIHIASQGEAEGLAELMSGFVIAVFAGVFLTFGVLVLLFKGFFKPVVTMTALPLSLLGAFASLHLFNKPLDLPSTIGLLMLMGLCAKNSILLVEFAIELERGGMAVGDALREACRERVRPIIMTTVAMAAGMMPAAIGLGEGAEFRQPMALAVIGGLITSTMLSLMLVPVIYEIVDQFERWATPKLARLVTQRPAEEAPSAS
ncbi:hydrophobic/amphiphilic exporter-1, HAE1 family [Sphingomonas laterariae]|uniref:Hydrophobic/amphiphilic exporter-1, HAE1 family n=1 Tax=Edaphosphingomonas laterariae TaxID=861865 RepID=A0A239FZ59_9SPHN|nr:efflux RND transporter permease subunit [Sphingomonas laterariae]SNS62191.1 hydrophobic/amphiphilic exporter-1, HAE1 family [Sphingomonas laterariae]